MAGAVVPEATVNRRQKKKEKTFEYEVKRQFKPIEANVWVEKDILNKMGYKKLVEREDERQAAMAGLQTKLLTRPGVEKHLGDCGVDPESDSHTQINQLSGAMKVKVVLAAAMWQNPHVLILDEPTNYLDREGLGALVLAIKEYRGGMLIISHIKEFCDGVATEKWIMNKGMLRSEGESVAKEEETGWQQAAGRRLRCRWQQDRCKEGGCPERQGQEEGHQRLVKKLKEGKKKKMSDEEIWEMEDKHNELKESLGK